VRRLGVEIGGEAVGVGVAGGEPPLLQPQRVGRADQLGRLVQPVGGAMGGLLVRDGDVAAGEASSQ